MQYTSANGSHKAKKLISLFVIIRSSHKLHTINTKRETIMPYRRLPNTDQARLRALRAACEAAEAIDPAQLKFSQRLALDAKAFLPIFEQAVTQYNDSRATQSQISRQMSEAGKQARLYLSHFVQVFNMCILRGEIKPEARQQLGLDDVGATLPDLVTDQQLIDRGTRIVEGEEARIAGGGGNRIYNPSIAVVKVKVSLFKEVYDKHRDILQTVQKHHNKLDEVRQKADALILDIWNDVESQFAPIDSEAKRQECASYGIVYFYRPQERHKEFLVSAV